MCVSVCACVRKLAYVCTCACMQTHPYSLHKNVIGGSNCKFSLLFDRYRECTVTVARTQSPADDNHTSVPIDKLDGDSEKEQLFYWECSEFSIYCDVTIFRR